jgi:hypothetical protein
MRPRIMFFDIETRKWASDLRPDDNEAGWDELRAGKGGASAIALYDTLSNFLYLYDDHTAETCAQHLEQADLVVGFCSLKFDVPCLEGLIHRRLRLAEHYDIYIELTMELAKRGKSGQRGDFTLNRLSKQNLGRGKIDHGSNAPELARKGQWGKLFNYCADDVHLTRDLFARICRDGGLINLGGKFTSLSVSEHFKAGMEDYL